MAADVMTVTTPMFETLVTLGLDGLADDEFDAWSRFVGELPDEAPCEEFELLAVLARVATRQAAARRADLSASSALAARLISRAIFGIEESVIPRVW